MSDSIVTIELTMRPPNVPEIPGWILIFEHGNSDLRPLEDRIIEKLGLRVRRTAGGALYASEKDAEAVRAGFGITMPELVVETASVMWPDIWRSQQ